MSGVINQIATLASKIEEPDRRSENKDAVESPVIRVDLEKSRMLIKSQDSITTALIFPQK